MNHALTKVEAQYAVPDLYDHYAVVIRGKPGAGKSTLSNGLLSVITTESKRTPFQINADYIRRGLNNHLGFTENDRLRQAQTLGYLARLAVDNGCVPVVDFVMPTEDTRQAFAAAFGLPFLLVTLTPYHSDNPDRYSDTSAIFDHAVTSDVIVRNDQDLADVVALVRKMYAEKGNS